MKDEKTIIKIARFLGKRKKDLILNLSQETLDKMIDMWHNDDVVGIHLLGYELKG